MEIILSLITFLTAASLIFFQIGHHIIHDLIQGSVSIVSIVFAVNAIRKERQETKSQTLSFIAVFFSGVLILLNLPILYFYMGRWIVALFVG